MPLFDVAILKKATKKELDDGAPPEELIFGPKSVLAADKQTAGMAAMVGPDAPKGLDLNRAEVLVRPFV